VPLVINYSKLLFEDKKQMVLDFARIKLSAFKTGDAGVSDSQRFLVLQAIIEVCDSNVTCNKNSFINVGKFSFKEISVACESMSMIQSEAQLLSCIDDLLTDPGVRFLKKVGQNEKTDKLNGIYSVNWEDIFRVV